MNLEIYSDLHLEFDSQQGRKFMHHMDPTDTDVLILAGDITVCKHLPYVIRTIAEKYSVPILFVAGNHEHYSSSKEEVSDTLTKLENTYSHFHWLNNKSILIDNKKFSGTTLWFRNDPLNVIYEKSLNDFRYIKNFSHWVYDANAEAISFIEKEIHITDVMITHHLPSSASISKKYVSSDMNRFYVCDLSEIILDSKLPLWIHGHSHEAKDYIIGDTRIYSNPKGYPSENNIGYRGKSFVTI